MEKCGRSAASRHEGDAFNTTVLAKRVSTTTVRLAIVVTLAG